tara:strand:- start:327 stop:485 length:159 start_codon:yes stop_codon:yes gene_type:complete
MGLGGELLLQQFFTDSPRIVNNRDDKKTYEDTEVITQINLSVMAKVLVFNGH